MSYKYNPVTECKLTPVELCGPAGCGVKEGPEECHDRRSGLLTITLQENLYFRTLVVYDKPEESCNLESFKNCQFVTKLVPHLKNKDECVGEYDEYYQVVPDTMPADIPLEICVRYDTNPRLVNKPVLKVWCYKAKTEESLA